MIPVDYLRLFALVAPEAILVLASLIVLGVDLFILREVTPRYRLKVCAMVALAGCVASFGWLILLAPQGSFQGLFASDQLIRIVKGGLLALCAAAVALSLFSQGPNAALSLITIHVGEYFGLMLLSLVGLMFLVSAEDMLGIFVALEFASITLYVLAAFSKRDLHSAEAGLKYFLFGGVSAAVTLFGFSLIYGYAGVTDLAGIGAAVRAKGADPLLVAGAVLALAGFGFKVAAAPFHLWAPDVYEGAPVISAAFIASASKLGGFFILAKFAVLAFGGPPEFGQTKLLAALAVASMVLGNLAAIVQSSVRRLLAYSAIAQAGYMLLGILAGGQEGMAALVFYASTYGLTALGAFAVLAIAGAGDRFADFAGLSRRSPLLAWSMLVFLLSLAGIPPLAGFFGKFYLFAAAIGSGRHSSLLLWLVILAVAFSAVSLFYYLQVLKWMFVEQEPAATSSSSPFKPAMSAQFFVVAIAVVVLLLGCAPDLLLQPVRAAFRASFTLPF